MTERGISPQGYVCPPEPPPGPSGIGVPKSAPVEVVIKVEGLDRVKELLTEAQHEAWEAGMRHALAWLGLRHYGDVMAKDNPHGSVDAEPPVTGFPPTPLRKNKVG